MKVILYDERHFLCFSIGRSMGGTKTGLERAAEIEPSSMAEQLER